MRDSAGIWGEETGSGGPRAGPSIAGWCPHPTGSRGPFPAARTRAAASGRVALSGTGLAFRWQCGGAGAFAPTPHPEDGPPQARFQPYPDSRPARAGTRGKDFSGGWSAACLPRDRQAASGATPVHRLLPLPAARYGSSERLSSRLVRNVRETIRRRECRRVWHGGRGCGKDWGDFCGMGVVGITSPPGGGECEFQRLSAS